MEGGKNAGGMGREKKKHLCGGKGGGEDEAAETHFITTLLPLQLHYLHSNNAGPAPAGPLLINNRAREGEVGLGWRKGMKRRYIRCRTPAGRVAFQAKSNTFPVVAARQSRPRLELTDHRQTTGRQTDIGSNAPA